MGQGMGANGCQGAARLVGVVSGRSALLETTYAGIGAPPALQTEFTVKYTWNACIASQVLQISTVHDIS
jgi:hypothetical protein